MKTGEFLLYPMDSVVIKDIDLKSRCHLADGFNPEKLDYVDTKKVGKLPLTAVSMINFRNWFHKDQKEASSILSKMKLTEWWNFRFFIHKISNNNTILEPHLELRFRADWMRGSCLQHWIAKRKWQRLDQNSNCHFSSSSSAPIRRLILNSSQIWCIFFRFKYLRHRVECGNQLQKLDAQGRFGE